MSNLLNSYPIFEKNQVLTSAQLNELSGYLEEQGRLTRAKLVGVGAVCGLAIKYVALDNLSAAVQFSITKGMGITSEGQLITLGESVMDRYKTYSLPTGVVYAPFQNTITKQQDVSLYEVLTVDAPAQSGTTQLTSGFLDGKVVLLYIECVDVDLLSCLGKACDDNGKDRVYNLRKLLISKDDMKLVFARSGCGSQSIPFQHKYSLPEIIMHKVLFSSDSSSSKDYFAMSKNYVSAIKSPVNPSFLQADIYTTLFNALKQTYIDFQPVLSGVYSSNPFGTMPLLDWNNFLNGAATSSAGPKYLGMQYFYDFIKDLILAYNEFRDVALAVMSECCADMECFPKHIMLGELPVPMTDTPSIYRNYFVKSAVFETQKANMESLIFYHKRMVLMVNKLDFTTFNPNNAFTSVYITPSVEKRGPLSDRSIPYYYKVNDATGGLGSLLKTWNYGFKAKDLYSKGLQPLTYINQDNPSTDKGPVITPLYYDTDPYDFFRIEGHLKMQFGTAKTKVEAVRNQFNLPFSVVTLRLNGNPSDTIKERCNFYDIRTEYGSIRIELLSLMQNVFDRYATLNSSGGVVVKDKPAFITALIADEDVSSATGGGGGSITPVPTGVAYQFSPAVNVAERTFRVAGIENSSGFARASVSSAAPTGAVSLNTNSAGAISLISATPQTLILTSNNVATSGNLTVAYAPQGTLGQIVTRFNNDVLDLVTALNTLINQNQLPYNVTDFKFGYTGMQKDLTAGFIQHYYTAMQSAINLKVDYNQMLDVIMRNTKVRNTPELYMAISGYWTEVVGLLERFITDARYKSLTLLNYTLAYRLNELQKNDLTLFSNFIKKHPGVEHKAGVKPGGTFIMVYSGNSVAIDPTVRNAAIESTSLINNLRMRRETLLRLDAMSINEQNELVKINSMVSGYTQVTRDLASSAVPIESINITGEQIIADFSLPYDVCMDCECEDIDHAADITKLGIPALPAPFYTEFSLGDYAFAKDVDLTNPASTSPVFEIDIIPKLQYERNLYPTTAIRLHLIDKSGNKLNYPNPLPAGTGIVQVTLMATRNYPNTAAEGPTAYGNVTVAYDKNFSVPQKFNYTPATSNKGMDSFYYMFEIEVAGTVVKRSSVGKVTISLI